MILFTGLIEEIGRVKNVYRSLNSIKLTISSDKVMNDMKEGDSIAVNGVCLTAVSCMNGQFDVMPETMRVTDLSNLKAGSMVNLESALKANGKFGGHIVSGHIDGVGRIDRIKRDSIALEFTISAERNIIKNIVYKGSVAVDGVSLTCSESGKDYFKFCLIPYTQEKTILNYKKEGELINIECDVIGKYVRKIICERKNDKKETITGSFLKENGFV